MNYKHLIFSVFLLLSAMAFGQNQSQPRPSLICSHDGNYLKITDGIQKWEKYLSGELKSTLHCSSSMAFAHIGSYLVKFHNGAFTEKYVSSLSGDAKFFDLKGEFGVAFIGSYLHMTKGSNSFVEKYVNNSDANPVLQMNREKLYALIGSYAYVADGSTVNEKYLGGRNEKSQIFVTRDMAVFTAGSYIVTTFNNQFQEKYISSSDTLVGIASPRRSHFSLVAFTAGSYFYVVDGQRKTISEKYVSEPGTLEIREQLAVHRRANGRITVYNSQTGQFTDGL